MANEARLIQEHGPNWTPERHYDHLRCVNPGRACPCCLQTCPICWESDSEESQVTPMDIEISNERAAELTAARAEIARLRASISVLRRRLSQYQEVNTRLLAPAAAPTPAPQVFSGQGHRLDE